MTYEPVYRRWGNWEVLKQGNYGDVQYKVKFLSIDPSKSISLQFHDSRDEYWTVLQGTGEAFLPKAIEHSNGVVLDELKFLKPGTMVSVPRGKVHKITNTGDETLIILELQMGKECDEEDITRLEKIDGEG